MKKNNTYKICNQCVMDTTDPNITFDENEICNHCKLAEKKIKKITSDDLPKIIKKIKKYGRNKKYDCVIGLSGGVDSSYLAYYIVKKLGLRPLAIHIDNGWNSELAVKNIENIVKKLNINLHTYVIDWDEFKNLQLAYLKASVIDLEVLSDNAIVIAIHKEMKKFKIKHFLIGYNLKAESIMASAWVYNPKYDSKNIRAINNKFGKIKKLKSYPLLSLFGYIKYRYFNKTQSINILDHIPYNKYEAIKTLQNELDWRDYGGKHYESKITHFYQAYILPKKFNVDKRKAHLSSLIISKQITREEALEELEKPIYKPDIFKVDFDFFTKKLNLTKEDFEKILNSPPKSHYDYKSYNNTFNKLIIFKNRIKSLFK